MEKVGKNKNKTERRDFRARVEEHKGGRFGRCAARVRKVRLYGKDLIALRGGIRCADG